MYTGPEAIATVSVNLEDGWRVEYALKAMPWPRPITTRPAMNTPNFPFGEKVCMKVAMIVRKAPCSMILAFISLRTD